MPNYIYLVHINHIFIQRSEPICFKSEEGFQNAIHEAIADCPESAQRTFEFATLEEAKLKANEAKDGFWKFDDGYARPGKWYYFEAEVAQIVEERIMENGDFDEEPVSSSDYYHPEIPYKNVSSYVIEENCAD